MKTNKLMSGLIFVYTCFVIISFEIPRTGLEKQPFMVLSKTDESFAAARKTILTDGLNIGVITAKNKIQTVSSDSSKDNAKVSLHNLILVSKNSNHFLDQIVLKIQKNLVKLPYVDTVAYRNNNQNIVSGEKRPDVFITLETSELSEEKFLLSRKTHVKISCAANNSASDARAASATDSNSYELIVPFTIQTELEHTSRSLCIECPGTEYEQEVKNISCELTEAITKQFENLLKKYEMAPEPAEKLYGTDIILQLLN